MKSSVVGFLVLSCCWICCAGDVDILYSDGNLICHFNNTSGVLVDGLRLLLSTPALPTHSIGLGASMELEHASDTELVFRGACVCDGTLEVGWDMSSPPFIRAEWLLDGEPVHELDVRSPTARMGFRRDVEPMSFWFSAVGSYDPDGAPLAHYRWEWSDGVIAEGVRVRRRFPSPGQYEVILTVSENSGLSTSTFRSVTVLPVEPKGAIASKLYVNNFLGDTTTVVDLATHQIVATIHVGDGPSKLVIVDGKVYIANRNSGTVSVIDSETDTVIATLSTGSNSWQMAYYDGYVYVGASSQVAVIDPSTNAVVATIPGVSTSRGLAFSGNKGYVTSQSSDSVMVFDTVAHTQITTIAVQSNPKGIISVGNKIYAFNNGSDTVSVIDSATDTVQSTIGVGNYPHQAALSDAKLYSATSYDDSVSVIDTATDSLTGTIAVGDYPGLAQEDSGRVFVPNQGSRDLSVIDASVDGVIATVPLGGIPHSSAIVGDWAYVSLIDAQRIAVINLRTYVVEDFVPAGLGARYMQILYESN